MCGIAGWVDFKKNLEINSQIIEEMTECQKHRGPDAQGFYISPNVLFGHRRLSVIDPENGTQPMKITYNDRTYVIIYNGELYNADEIRSRLISRKHSFSTKCDTEVLLRAYIEFSEDCITMLNGIFAFAIYDIQRNRLFLGRDHFGVKPLFYYSNGSTFLFSSELKALLRHPQVSPSVGLEGLSEIFFVGPARTGGFGIYDNVSELLPGHYIIYDGLIHLKQYFSLKAQMHTDSLKQTATTVRDLLSDSIKRQLVSDVPLCTFLSGGLDSSIITAIAANEYAKESKQLRTFSLEFLENEKYFTSGAFQGSLDTPWIEEMVDKFKTLHKFVFLDSTQTIYSSSDVKDFNFDEKVYNSLKSATLSRDLPGMADIDSSLLHFCSEVKNYSTVAISGECADEIFGGYPWFYKPGFEFTDNFPWNRSFELRKNILSKDLLSKLNPDEFVKSRVNNALNKVPLLPGESEEEKQKRQLSFLNFHYFMSNLLERKDRMSMYSGLEVRVPFCDPRLVQYVYNIPWTLKFLDGQEKGILRYAFKDVLPTNIVYRKKNPYPKTYNPLFDKSIRRLLSDILDNSNSKILPLLNTHYIKSLLNDTTIPSMPWYGQLMDLTRLFAYIIQMEQWLGHYDVQVRM